MRNGARRREERPDRSRSRRRPMPHRVARMGRGRRADRGPPMPSGTHCPARERPKGFPPRMTSSWADSRPGCGYPRSARGARRWHRRPRSRGRAGLSRPAVHVPPRPGDVSVFQQSHWMRSGPFGVCRCGRLNRTAQSTKGPDVAELREMPEVRIPQTVLAEWGEMWSGASGSTRDDGTPTPK